MKLITFCIVVIAIPLTSTFQTSCKTRMSHHNDQNGQVTRADPVDQSHFPNDDQLLKEVERFASSDEHSSLSAWQSLQSRSRSKLIEDLTRIMRASAPDDRNRVLIAFTFCRLGHEYASNQKVVVSALSQKPPFKNFLGDWAVSLVGRLMVLGDKDLLVPLFDVSKWSDGAMSLELAHAYSQGLAIDPETFLQMLSSQPLPTRSRVIKLLKYNSLTAEENTRVKSHLKNASRQPKLRLIAEQTIRALTN